MKKKILISVYDMEIGGIERSLINMLESFDYSIYDIDLLIFNHTGEFMKFIPKEVNILPQIDEYAVFRKSIITCLKEGHYKTSFIRIICKYLSKIKCKLNNVKEGQGYYQIQLALKYGMKYLPILDGEYDVSISYAWPHDITVNKVKAKKKIGWIHTDYSILEIDNKIDYSIWRQFDNIVSISEGCTNSFLTKYPLLKEKIIHMENITSVDFIRKLSKEKIEDFPINEMDFNLLSVGRYSEAKGFDNAILALKKLYDKGYKNIKWYVIGYGSDEEKLKELIKKNDLESSFILLGKKINPYPYMRKCDLYVQPSRYEGKAVTVTEAKILNKPILITNYPTASSQIENGFDGIICKLSVDGIVNAIEDIIENKILQNALIYNTSTQNYENSNELNKLYKIM